MKRNAAAERRRLAGVSLRVLSPDGVDDIHLATLEVLGQAGVFVESDDALDVLADGGCRVDLATKMVRIPPHVVEDAVRSAPPTLVLHGRDRARDVVVERGRGVFTSFGEGIFVIDPFSGERREPRKEDVAASAAAVDALDELGICNRALGAHDVPPQVAALHTADAILRSTTKHVFLGPQNGFLAERIVGLQAAILGSADAVRERPLVTFTTCPVSPLKLARDCCEVILAGVRSGVGINVVSMAMAGGSSPITLAGTLVVHNAEVLAGITLAQLAERGAPVIYGSVSTGMDLRLASASVGSPELALITAAVAQLAQHYRLPSFVAGGLGDSKLPDAQSGHEKTLTATFAALAGANVIAGAGIIESGLTFDFGQLVMDAELVGMIRQCAAGIRVDDETLAVDDICAVGSSGDYLSLEATMRHMREQSQPRYIDRRVHEDWLALGGTDIHERSLAEARRILREYRPEPLPDDVQAQMTRLVAEAEARPERERKRARS
ncbi:MAG: trimethylamine methyltransferase family protein [Actinomycetes bacterium]